MWHIRFERVECVRRLLEDPRVVAGLEEESTNRYTALHLACTCREYALTIPLLLQAGADPTAIIAGNIDSHLRVYMSDVEVYPEAIELVRALADINCKRTSLLVHALRVVMISARALAASTALGLREGNCEGDKRRHDAANMPSYLNGRIAQGQPLPRLELTPEGPDAAEDELRFRGAMAFVLGLEGGGMPRDVFRGVFMDLLMPSWHPLRKQETEQEQE